MFQCDRLRQFLDFHGDCMFEPTGGARGRGLGNRRVGVAACFVRGPKIAHMLFDLPFHVKRRRGRFVLAGGAWGSDSELSVWEVTDERFT